MTLWRFWMALALAAGLAACGGGGSGNDDDDTGNADDDDDDDDGYPSVGGTYTGETSSLGVDCNNDAFDNPGAPALPVVIAIAQANGILTPSGTLPQGTRISALAAVVVADSGWSGTVEEDGDCILQEALTLAHDLGATQTWELNLDGEFDGEELSGDLEMAYTDNTGLRCELEGTLEATRD